jgi:hypothetical protein
MRDSVGSSKLCDVELEFPLLLYLRGLSLGRAQIKWGTFLQMAPTCYTFGSIVSDFVAVAFEGLPRTNG